MCNFYISNLNARSFFLSLCEACFELRGRSQHRKLREMEVFNSSDLIVNEQLIELLLLRLEILWFKYPILECVLIRVHILILCKSIIWRYICRKHLRLLSFSRMSSTVVLGNKVLRRCLKQTTSNIIQKMLWVKCITQILLNTLLSFWRPWDRHLFDSMEPVSSFDHQ